MAEDLFTETSGTGEDLVLIHGWGMHGGIWTDFVPRLSGFRVTRVDLPGHGHSAMISDWSLSTVVASLLETVPRPAHWVGWSLGALIALEAARWEPPAVNSVTLLCGTPRFVAEPDWPGMDLGNLMRFGADFLQDYPAALQRFLALQLLGTANERALLRRLRALLAERPTPHPRALRAGLEVLRWADLREVFMSLSQPMLAILGARDRLVPSAVAEVLVTRKPDLVCRVIDGASHIPFVTHPEPTARLIHGFLAQQKNRS
ncbi:MAG TPA: pimeloyl-ACP methyl ester esterase BioH [Methylococcus sp.]|nr:pimeloyl-ACP methyl ester esterase BioH [Methylococcus sp.]